MSRTWELVELPSFFEGETKILSCFQKTCLVQEKTSAELQARDAGLQLLGGVRARSWAVATAGMLAWIFLSQMRLRSLCSCRQEGWTWNCPFFSTGQGCSSALLSGIECPSLSFSPAAGARGHVAPRGGRPDRLMSEQIWDSASVWMTRCWLEVHCVYHCFLRPEGKAAGRLIKGLKGSSSFFGGPSAPACSLLKGCLVIPTLPFLSTG